MNIKEYDVLNLGCAGCAAKIQYEGSLIAGVINSNLDLQKKKMTLEVEKDFDEDNFLEKINKIADKLEPGTKIQKKSMEKTKIYSIENLHCAGCAAKIQSSITNLPEVENCNKLEPGTKIQKKSMEKTKIYSIENLHCAGCAAKIQSSITNLPEVENCNIDIYKNQITIELKNSVDEEFFDRINTIADKIEPGTKFIKINDDDDEIDSEKRALEIAKEEAKEKREKLLLTIGAILFVVSIFLKPLPNIRLAVSIIAYLILGGDVVVKSFKNITKGNFLDENFLMTIATFGAFYLGETMEAVGVMLFYKVGEYFQESAVKSSRKSIEKLMDIKPEFANIRNEKNELVQVSPKKLKIGDIIIVKAGEKVPVD